MSEKQPASPERQFENLDTSQEQERLKQILESRAEQESESGASLAELAKHVEVQAVSGKEVSVGEKEHSNQSPIGQQKDLKNTAFNRTLHRVQTQLPAPQRIFSRTIHNPVIDKVSSVGARTVARPSGVLGGGLAAVLGSSFVLFYSKRYGFAYNYFLFVALFVTGFLLGVVIELVIKFLKRKRTQY